MDDRASNAVIDFIRITGFNMPRLTRLVGIALILIVGAIHLYAAPEHFGFAVYLGVLFVANGVLSLVSALGILRGVKTWGWLLGAVISALAILAYLASRFFGLPGFAEAMGRWDTALGSFAMIVEGLFIVGYATVATGMNVAAPEGRAWHD